MDFSTADYKTALEHLETDSIRLIIKELHEVILISTSNNKNSDIYKLIDERENIHQCKGSETYKVFLYDKIWNRSKPSKNTKANGIDFLLYLYQSYKFYAEYVKDTATKIPTIRWDENNKPYIIPYQPVEGTVYDCFYWRTEQNQIGVASLVIHDDWKRARMVFHYKRKTKPATYLAGEIWEEGSNLYIQLQDDQDLQEPYVPIITLIVLYASTDSQKRQYLMGCYSSVNRDLPMPICGMMVMHMSSYRPIDETPYLTDGSAHDELKTLVNIPEEISFLLTQKRLKIPNKVIQNNTDLPLFDQYDKLKVIEGSYQAYFFTFHSREPSFKSRFTQIRANGLVRSFLSENNSHNFDEGVLRRFGDIVTIQFKYEQQYDSFKYHYYLQMEDQRYLRGIFAGVSDNGLITSGRIILKAIPEKDEVQNNLNQTTRITKNRLPSKITTILEESTLSEFFGIDGGGAYDHFTDISLAEYINSENPQRSASHTKPERHPNLEGTFLCYCITKDVDYAHSLADKDILLEQLPIRIEGAKTFMKHGTQTVQGNLFYDGHTRFRIVFLEDLYTLTFTIPFPRSERATNLTHMFGITSRVNEKHPEASAAVLIKVDYDFDNTSYNQHHTLESLINLDSDHQGVMSFLMGDWNRFIRMPSTANRPFRPRHSTYRRSFWAAACYWGLRYQDTHLENDRQECLNNLTRAFRHGFAMDKFSNTEFNKPDNFPKELREDREMLLNELNRSLNFDEAHDLIERVRAVKSK